MSRNGLLEESLRMSPSPRATTPGVWSMCLSLIGAAFGAPRVVRRPRR